MNESETVPASGSPFGQIMRLIVISGLIAAILTGGLLWFISRDEPTLALGGDFTLHGADRPVSLQEFRGDGVVLYFGYTSCPDACPLSMGKLARIWKKLSASQRDHLRALFISVDYRGDTPAKVQKYVTFFMQNAIGLTGSKAELDQVTAKYGTSYGIEDTPKSALGYSVLHPMNFYLIDVKGRLRKAVPTDAPDDEIREEIESLL